MINLNNDGPFRSGEGVSGKVVLEVPASTDNTSTALSISLRLVRHEECRSHNVEDSAPNSDKLHAYFFETHKCDSTVYQSPMGNVPSGELAAGKYEFPFLFIVPPGIVGKQGKAVKDQSYLLIKYSLEAEVFHFGKQTRVTYSVPLHLTRCPVSLEKKTLVISPRSQKPVHSFLGKRPSCVNVLTQPCQLCCCCYCFCSCCNVHATIRIDDSNVIIGENIIVDVTFDGCIPICVHSVLVQLVEIVQPRSPTTSRRHGAAIPHRYEICHVSVPRSQWNTRPNASAKAVQPSSMGAYQQVASSHVTASLRVPSSCQESFAGSTGAVKHVLAVNYMYSCCEQAMAVEKPVTVYGARAVAPEPAPETPSLYPLLGVAAEPPMERGYGDI